MCESRVAGEITQFKPIIAEIHTFEVFSINQDHIKIKRFKLSGKYSKLEISKIDVQNLSINLVIHFAYQRRAEFLESFCMLSRPIKKLQFQ